MAKTIEARTIKTEEARRRLSLTDDQKTSVEDTRALIEGDHWGDGRFWIGLQPDPNNEYAIEVFELLKIGFVSRNMTREIVDRIVTAILGREPDWKIVFAADEPAEGEDTAAGGSSDQFAEYDRKFVEYWTSHEVKDALSKYLFNLAAYGRGTLRIYIPNGYAEPDANGNPAFPDNLTFEDALDMIYIEAPEYEDCGIVRDPDLMKPYGITVLKPDENRELLEITFVENGKTFIRQIIAKDAKTLEASQLPDLSQNENVPAEDRPENQRVFGDLDLGGNLLVFEKKRRPVVTEQIKQNQKALNFNLTMLEHNIFGAGFAERTIINADLPSREVPNPNKPGETMRVLENMPRGVGTMQALVGLTTLEKRPDGSIAQKIERPEVIDREPSDPESFIKAIGETKQNILEESHQTYVQLAKRAEASGESRIEAKDDFFNSIIDIETAANDAGIWAISSIIRLAFNMCKKQALVRKFKTIFKSKMYIGNATSDEKRVAREEWKDGIRTTRSLLLILGSDDPDSEILALLDEEPTRRKLEKLLFQPVDNAGNNQPPSSTDAQKNRNNNAGDGGNETKP